MALRLIEAIVPEPSADTARDILAERSVIGCWEEPLANEMVLFRILLQSDEAEAVLDALDARLSGQDGFRTIVFSVEATSPRPEEKAKTAGEGAETPTETKTVGRISREELYDDVTHGARVSRVFVVTVVLSTVVAGIGLVRDDVAVVIGAMVIAPLLGPNVALALATTLGDVPLALRSLKVNAVGVVVALALAIGLGFLLHVDPTVATVASRTDVGLGDVALALAAGSAAALAFTSGVPAALIGVMVAVALLPPLVVFGLLLASANYGGATGAVLLLATNVICVNLAAVATFLVQGVQPRSWWEASRAKRASRIVIAVWATLLAILIALIYIAS